MFVLSSSFRLLSASSLIVVLFHLLSCWFSSFGFCSLVLSPLLYFSYSSFCYSFHRSSLYSSSSRHYCLHNHGSSSVPSSGVSFPSNSSPSSIIESAADVTSLGSSNLRVYSCSLWSDATHFFTYTCPLRILPKLVACRCCDFSSTRQFDSCLNALFVLCLAQSWGICARVR